MGDNGEQARAPNGEFSSGTANGGEAGQRERKRYVVRPHVGQQSVGTHTGRQFAGNLAKALLGVAAGAAGTFVKSALRNQGRRH